MAMIFGLEHLADAMGFPEVWLLNFLGMLFIFLVVLLMAKFEAPAFSIILSVVVIIFINVYVFQWPLFTVMIAGVLTLATFIAFFRGEGGEM